MQSETERYEKLAVRWRAVTLWSALAWVVYFLALIAALNLIPGPAPSWIGAVMLPILLLGALMAVGRRFARRYRMLAAASGIRSAAADIRRSAAAIEALQRRGPRTYGRNRKRKR